jgi:hypothetical protein
MFILGGLTIAQSAYAISVGGWSETPGNLVCAPMSFPPNATTVQTTAVTVPNNGQMYLLCMFPAASGINTVNYSQ